MLKIKDKVDLKELEKFGFKYDKDYLIYRKEIRESDCDLCVNTIDREIFHENYSTADMVGYATDLSMALFDIIQAGFVEKVEGV